jgi:uncharacterized RDD family membrane protein YckC
LFVSPPPSQHAQPAEQQLLLSDWPSDQPTIPINVRAAFTNAVGPGVVDLFEDVPILEPRTERPSLPELPQQVQQPWILQGTLPEPIAVSAPGTNRGRRLAARIVSFVGAGLALLAGVLLVAFSPNVIKSDRLMSLVFFWTPLGLYGLYNLTFLAIRGQDFGKRALKLRIVSEDGTPARFVQTFLKRELVLALLLIGLIPLIWKVYQAQQAGILELQWQRQGWRMLLPELAPAAAGLLMSLLNLLLIFGPDARCLHDRLAKTKVIRE